LAISDRLLAVSFSARALPPLSPPKRPKATAAGFLEGVSSCGVDCLSATSTLCMLRAGGTCESFCDNLLLERLGILILYQRTRLIQVNFSILVIAPLSDGGGR